MISKFLDFDPFSGIEQTFHYNPETDETTIESKVHDLGPTLDACMELRNRPGYSQDGMKSGWWHYAYIPNILIEKWRAELGVNVWDKNDNKKVFRLLNDEFSKLKATDGTHAPKR